MSVVLTRIDALGSALRGERAGREAFVREHQDDVFRAVARILGAPFRDRWEDVAQDAMLKVLRALPGFTPDGEASPRTWVLTIAARAAIDALRRGRREDARRRRPEPDHADDERPDQVASARELSARVARAMDLLPDDQRVALVMRAYHDLDYAEIALATATTVPGVKARLHRARAALARLLGRDEGGPP